jgi:hypothetical protein
MSQKCGGARPDMHRTPACRNPGAWHCAATANPKLARGPEFKWRLKASGCFRKRDREEAGAVRNALNLAQEPVPFRGLLQALADDILPATRLVTFEGEKRSLRTTASRLQGLGVSVEASVPLVQHCCRPTYEVDEVQSTRVGTNSQHATLCWDIAQMIDRDGGLTRTKAFGELASLISMVQAKGQFYCV